MKALDTVLKALRFNSMGVFLSILKVNRYIFLNPQFFRKVLKMQIFFISYTQDYCIPNTANARPNKILSLKSLGTFHVFRAKSLKVSNMSEMWKIKCVVEMAYTLFIFQNVMIVKRVPN